MLTLLSLLLTNAACLGGLHFWRQRQEQRAEIGEWAPFQPNPVLDPLLKSVLAQPEQPTRRWLAHKVKTNIRSFTASSTFSMLIDALFAYEGQLRGMLKLKTQPSELEGKPDHICTIR